MIEPFQAKSHMPTCFLAIEPWRSLPLSRLRLIAEHIGERPTMLGLVFCFFILFSPCRFFPKPSIGLRFTADCCHGGSPLSFNVAAVLGGGGGRGRLPVDAAAAAAAATPAAAAVLGSRTGSAAVAAAAAAAALTAGRGADEGEVDVNGLVEELGLMGRVDGGAGLGKGGVLDKCVALVREEVLVSGASHFRYEEEGEGEECMAVCVYTFT